MTDDIWDLGAGDDASLAQLHALVPAAEEVDILDDARDAEHREYVRRVMDEASTPLDIHCDDEDEPLTSIHDTRPIIGLLCDELGATVIGEFTTE